MSEGNEGVPIPEEAKAPKVELDEYGQIKHDQPLEQSSAAPIVDADDLPENQGLRPGQNLASLRDRLANSTPVTAISGEIKPVTQEARDAKHTNTVQEIGEVVRRQTTPPGQSLSRYANPAPPQTGQNVNKKA